MPFDSENHRVSDINDKICELAKKERSYSIFFEAVNPMNADTLGSYHKKNFQSEQNDENK